MPLNFLFYLSFICICLTGWNLLQIFFYIFEVWLMLVLMLVFRPIILPLCRQIIFMLPQERHLRKRSLHFLQHVDFFSKEYINISGPAVKLWFVPMWVGFLLLKVIDASSATTVAAILASLCWQWGFTLYVKERVWVWFMSF